MNPALRFLPLLVILLGCTSSPRPAPVDPKIEIASRQMASIDQEIQLFYLDRDRLPHSLGEVLVDVPPDPWGSRYLYEVRSDGRPVYRLTSAGPDGVLGSGDDLQIGAIR